MVQGREEWILTNIVTLPTGKYVIAAEADSHFSHSPDVARKRPISVVMVSYMTGPALMEAITAVLADRDIHELIVVDNGNTCLLYTSPSPRDLSTSRMPSSA